MSARRSGGAPAAAPAPAPDDAAFAAVVSAPGLPPFVVWSRRPLEEAAADALNDAARTLRTAGGEAAESTVAAVTALPAPQAAERRSRRAARAYRTAYHAKASL